jgi:hypothetical protein
MAFMSVWVGTLGKQGLKGRSFCCIGGIFYSCWAIRCCACRIWHNTSVCAATKASVSVVGGGGDSLPLPNAPKSLGVLRDGLTIWKLSFHLIHFQKLAQKIIKLNMHYETRLWWVKRTRQQNGHKHRIYKSLLIHWEISLWSVGVELRNSMADIQLWGELQGYLWRLHHEETHGILL